VAGALIGPTRSRERAALDIDQIQCLLFQLETEIFDRVIFSFKHLAVTKPFNFTRTPYFYRFTPLYLFSEVGLLSTLKLLMFDLPTRILR